MPDGALDNFYILASVLYYAVNPREYRDYLTPTWIARNITETLLWLLQQRLSGSTQEGKRGRIGPLHLAARGIIQRVPQELGKTYPENIRARPPHLPQVPRADARHFLHRRSRRHKKDPQAPQSLGGQAQAPTPDGLPRLAAASFR